MYTADAKETFFILDRWHDKWYKYIGIENLIKGMVKTIAHDLNELYNNIDFTGCDKTVGCTTYENTYTREISLDNTSLRLPYSDVPFSESEAELYINMELNYKYSNGTVIGFTNESVTLRFRNREHVYDSVPTRPKQYMILRDNHDGTCRLMNIRGYEKEIKAELTTYQAYLDNIATRRYKPRHVDKKRIYTGATPGERLSVPAWKSGKHTFLFRQGPVPDIHHCGRWRYTTKKQYKHYLVHAEDIRPKVRMRMECASANYYRQDGHSWKSSYKCRHQYEKHLIRRSKSNNTYLDTFYDDEPELDMYQILEEDFENNCA